MKDKVKVLESPEHLRQVYKEMKSEDLEEFDENSDQPPVTAPS